MTLVYVKFVRVKLVHVTIVRETRALISCETCSCDNWSCETCVCQLVHVKVVHVKIVYVKIVYVKLVHVKLVHVKLVYVKLVHDDNCVRNLFNSLNVKFIHQQVSHDQLALQISAWLTLINKFHMHQFFTSNFRAADSQQQVLNEQVSRAQLSFQLSTAADSHQQVSHHQIALQISAWLTLINRFHMNKYHGTSTQVSHTQVSHQKIVTGCVCDGFEIGLKRMDCIVHRQLQQIVHHKRKNEMTLVASIWNVIIIVCLEHDSLVKVDECLTCVCDTYVRTELEAHNICHVKL